MGINSELWNSPAVRGDFTGSLIRTSMALDSIALALEGVQKGDDITTHVEEIRKLSAEIYKAWNELTGWTDDQ
jgi:hypothetical protein